MLGAFSFTPLSQTLDGFWYWHVFCFYAAPLSYNVSWGVKFTYFERLKKWQRRSIQGVYNFLFFSLDQLVTKTQKISTKWQPKFSVKIWKNKPKRVFGLQVRCRELDIFKIRNFLRNFLDIFGIFEGNILDFLEEFFGGIFWEDFFWRNF